MIEAAKDPATGICPELAARIHYAFPAYSVEWLRTGWALTRPRARKRTRRRRYRCRGAGHCFVPSITGATAAVRARGFRARFSEPGVVVWDFGPDGLLNRYESYLKVATVPMRSTDRAGGCCTKAARCWSMVDPGRTGVSRLVGHGDGPRRAFRIQKGGSSFSAGARKEDPAAATGIAAAGLPAFRSSEIRPYGASVPVRPDGQRISFRPLRSVRFRSPCGKFLRVLRAGRSGP